MTAHIRQRLLAWFDRQRRDLPWRSRAARDNPYRIWLAEMMLQQTRVPTVIPYYERFLRAFPTVGRLARARPQRVLRLWAGLGYYQRARHLQAAAKKIVREHGGRFPRSLEEALELPGVGAYTARALLSIAYGKPLGVVDGNVARVLVRVFRLEAADPEDRAGFQPLADRLVSRARPGDFNQALMELGSTICLPRIPRCRACPLERVCRARRAGVEQRIPRRRRRRARARLTLNVLVLRRNGRLLLAREPFGTSPQDKPQGLFSGLWHFPYTRGRTPRPLARALAANGLRHVGTLEHQTTMRDLILRVYESKANKDVAAHKNLRWARPTQIEGLGVGAATRKIAAMLEGGA